MQKIQRAILVALSLAVVMGVAGVGTRAAFADRKFGKQVRFVGVHPIPKSDGGGMCYIEGPHVHIYQPNKLEYREHGPDHDHYFVGDPGAYNYDGKKYAYRGPHPIHVETVVGGDPDEQYCYIEGPHYHNFPAPEGPDFRLVGNAYFYVGEPPHAFVEARPTYVGINAYYRPITYERPVVEVEAPTGWIGARAEWGIAAPGAVVVDHRGGAAVVAPGVSAGISAGVDVRIPTPSVHIGVDIGGGPPPTTVIVHDRPGAVIIDHRDHDHHDNGRHEGERDHRGGHR